MKRVIVAGTVALGLLGWAGWSALGHDDSALSASAVTASASSRAVMAPAAPAAVAHTSGASLSTASSSPTVPPPHVGSPASTAPGPVARPAAAAVPAGPAAAPAAAPAAFDPATSPAALMANLGPLPTGWAASVHSVVSGGLPRDYLVIRPSALSGKVPVVVLMPGRGMTPDQMLHQSDLASALAATGPAILVAPAGWHESWDAGDCCSAAYTSHVDDVAFIQTVVDSVFTSTPAADRTQLYAVGFSNGGRMAYHLGCDMPGQWRGFVAVEAVPVEACSSMAPVSVTVVAQQNDPMLTISSGPPKTIQGFPEPTVAETVAHMQALDHCPGASSGAHGAAEEQTASCPGAQVRYVLYPGGDHSWRAPAAGTPGATDFVLQLMGRGPLVAAAPHTGA